jgi:integrase
VKPSEIASWLFCTEAGTPLDRHTFASLLLKQGKIPAYMQRHLGHPLIQLTVDAYGK